MLIELIHNAALLVALSALYGLLARFRRHGAVRDKVLAGLLFGGLAIAAMNMPYHYSPGVIYDGRSIVLTLAGLFGGGIAAAVSVALAGAYRGYLGGPGVWAGTATILLCAMLGLAVRRLYKNRSESVGLVALYGVGIAAHVVMLVCQLLLPWPGALETIGRIYLPVMLVFPAATLLVGILLGNEERRLVATGKLRESEAKYTAAFNTSPDAININGLDGRFVDTNEGFTRLTGFTREEVIGKSSLEIDLWAIPEDREKLVRGLKENGYVENLESMFRCKDGSLKTALMSARFISINNESHILSITRDVTRYLDMENQLRQAQKMETIGKLAGGIAHDFNNLLMVILGYVELVLNDLDSAHRHHGLLTEVQQAGCRARDITRQLLVFSRKQILQPVVLNLNDSVENLQRMLGRLIGEDIEVLTSFAGDLGPVEADPGQVEQVLMNLVVNARDAMPRGGKLMIETANVALDEEYTRNHVGVAPGRYVMLAVTDTGCGMDKETLGRIFDPFFTTKEFGKGTGLGLSTVYGIVSQSGGHIACRSEPGQGTTFRIYLPRTEGSPVRQAEPAPDQGRPGGGEHILVAEDEGAVRDLIRQMLERLGYRVTLAADGNDALALVTEQGLDPDLVITDVVMPGMSGKELMDRLRKNRPEQRFLYMSGYADSAIGHRGVLDPDTPFLQKPFTNIRDFAARIEEALRSGERNLYSVHTK
jgi:PAS domain S-box-containing protein